MLSLFDKKSASDHYNKYEEPFEGGEQKMMATPPWDAKIRRMENDDIALPFSCAFVLKRFENFDS